MTQILRTSVLFAGALLLAVSTFAQERNLWRAAADIREGVRGIVVGTVVDVSEGRNELQLEPDEDRSSRVVVAADAVTTQYNGFGGVINGKPEIFTGTAGFANVRLGDRVEVRGVGRGTGTVVAEQISLLGRPVPASQTGVGTTRSPSSVATPTTSPTTPERIGRVEGTVRQVNTDEGRIVIETDRREMLTVRVSSTTPVHYRGEVYRVGNLQQGDRIRVEPDTTTSTGEIRARAIDVLRSVQEGGERNRIGMLSGRVTRVDRNLDMLRIDTARGEVRIDIATATDDSGHRVRAADFHVGDRLDLTGRYGPTGDIFFASTVRFAGGGEPRGGGEERENVISELASVTIYATVRETLATSPQLVIRDQSGRSIQLNVLEDFVVRTRSGGYTTAERLKEGDAIVVKAFRDEDGNYIAQTIRIR